MVRFFEVSLQLWSKSETLAYMSGTQMLQKFLALHVYESMLLKGLTLNLKHIILN